MADSNYTSFGSVFASGIQDVAAVAGVFGTDICDTNAGLALTMGYLFPAACGMSMFGALGLAKYILKSSLPPNIAKNLGIEIIKFDKYRIDKVIHDIINELPPNKKDRLHEQNVRIRIRVPSYGRSTWIGAFASCFLLSCFNFIPYVPHYRTLLLYPEDPSDSSDPYIYYPLLLTFSSFVATFVCWFDAAIMLSGSPLLYTIKRSDMKLFEPYHFGSLFARRIGYVIGLLAAIGIVIGYIGSYLVVQKMTPTDTYYWLGLEFIMCFLRLAIWSWNTEKDELNVVNLRYKIDRSDEGVIRQIRDLPLSASEQTDVISKLKTGGYFIQSEIADVYYQARCYIHDFCFRNFNDLRIYRGFTSYDIVSKPRYYILWNNSVLNPQKILVVHDLIGSLTELQTRRVSYVKIPSISCWTYYFTESEFEPLTEEQVGAAMLDKLKSEMDAIAPWISFVTSRKQFDPELEEDEQMYKDIELKPQQA
ncbi:uncharacterized protein RHIMIDRAFT_250232 [Rhizopus microsporus ATCC 52813]|uniref:Uncharacterized protein n=1 Tax=Rhizopus microsporus ATCC 52813 TaxID=1340429 RepID=A0A2G4SZ82_RHIZD|nr:uncharacterized protein RHIMIDRAFT_250232 [Rhizopus microsporus ATCC 52813]PHZ14067.1 hypothetical protein RHIMIDRAFT_250232 [Rhizopus microsporus ATCC 52813]